MTEPPTPACLVEVTAEREYDCAFIHVVCDTCGFDKQVKYCGDGVDAHVVEVLRLRDLHDAEPTRTDRLRAKAERAEAWRAKQRVERALERIPPARYGEVLDRLAQIET